VSAAAGSGHGGDIFARRSANHRLKELSELVHFFGGF
jgi:hypothetical protein